MATTTPRPAESSDSSDLAGFGYKQELDRSLGSFSSFAAGFSYISILTGTTPRTVTVAWSCSASSRASSTAAAPLGPGSNTTSTCYEPVRVAGEVVGRVTSGGYGYTVERSIAYAYLPPAVEIGTGVEVDVFGEWVSGEVTRPSRCSTRWASGSAAS